MAIFKDALPYILRHEGGWSNDPDDPGGATNYGITLATAQLHGIRTKEALRTITPEQVAAIYEADYWRFNGIHNQSVATKLFDMGVNMGLRSAVKLAQGALNAMGADVEVDGVYGPQTEACINAVSPSRMLDLLCTVSADHYRGIVKARPRSAKFLCGWLKRAAATPGGSLV